MRCAFFVNISSEQSVTGLSMRVDAENCQIVTIEIVARMRTGMVKNRSNLVHCQLLAGKKLVENLNGRENMALFSVGAPFRCVGFLVIQM